MQCAIKTCEANLQVSDERVAIFIPKVPRLRAREITRARDE